MWFEGPLLALRTWAAAGAGDLTSAWLLTVIWVPQRLWAGGICGAGFLGMPLCNGVLGIGSGYVLGGEAPGQFVEGSSFCITGTAEPLGLGRLGLYGTSWDMPNWLCGRIGWQWLGGG